jgi:regulator of sigma E protease
MNWYILAIIPVLGLLVFVHELGHFLAAKWAGIHVEEFGMGFPPALVSIRRREKGGWDVLWFRQGREHDDAGTQNPFGGVAGGPTSKGEESDTDRPYRATLYSLNLLPIGGFVRMPGETGDAVDEQGKYDPDSFAAKSAGKRIIVLCAGVFMNLVLAFVLFSVAYGVGEPVFSTAPVLGAIEQGSPAAAAGLRPNDRIISVNDKPVNTFADAQKDVSDAIKGDKSDKSTVPVKLVIQHSDSASQETVYVDARKKPGEKQGALGVNFKVEFTLVKTPFWQAPFKGVVLTYNMLHEFFSAIKQMIVGAIQPQIAGPVGIAQITGDVAQRTPTYGWWPILTLTAFLSLNLAIMNILPFPALDGGRVVLVLIELLRGGKRLKPEREGAINFIGIAILLLLMVVVTVNDVIHWGG